MHPKIFANILVSILLFAATCANGTIETAETEAVHSGNIEAVVASGTEGIDQGGTEGIDQGGTEGIDLSGTEGIDQGGTEGIDQGGTEGIDQGGTEGIDQGGTEGIDQGGTEGIDLSGTEGIDQGGTEGIDQGGTEGIDQGGTEGIDQGGTEGIDQGGTEGIDQGGTEGIDQGGTEGIDQGGTEGIDQGGTEGIDQGGTEGIDQGGTEGIDQGGTEGIDQGGTEAVVTGGIQIDPLAVDGLLIDYRSAAMTRDGQPVSVSDIRQGQVATVTGLLSDNALVAQTVSLASKLTGQVEHYDAASDTISLLGHMILVNPATIMNVTRKALANGALIVVDGLPNDSGEILATRVDNATTTHVELAGVVSEADFSRLSFSIGSQRIDYSSASLLDLSAGQPRNGEKIRVTGDLSVDGNFLRAQFVRETIR